MTVITINIIIIVIINILMVSVISIMMVSIMVVHVQDQAATIQTLEAERNKLREQCAEISQRSMIIIMIMMTVVVLLPIFTITIQIDPMVSMDHITNFIYSMARLDHMEGENVSTAQHKRLELKIRELESKLELEKTTKQRQDTQVARQKEVRSCI